MRLLSNPNDRRMDSCFVFMMRRTQMNGFGFGKRGMQVDVHDIRKHMKIRCDEMKHIIGPAHVFVYRRIPLRDWDLCFRMIGVKFEMSTSGEVELSNNPHQIGHHRI